MVKDQMTGYWKLCVIVLTSYFAIAVVQLIMGMPRGIIYNTSAILVGFTFVARAVQFALLFTRTRVTLAILCALLALQFMGAIIAVASSSAIENKPQSPWISVVMTALAAISLVLHLGQRPSKTDPLWKDRPGYSGGGGSGGSGLPCK